MKCRHPQMKHNSFSTLCPPCSGTQSSHIQASSSRQ
ncbi:hypothetical protein XENTR_v10022789 [Xenopus tropicalis]|nr:hypothetical protein XENTR_v10022789 [Xenopus tropicalis]